MSCEDVNVEGAAPRSVPPPLNSGERSIDQCADRLRAGVPIPAALHTPTNTSRGVNVGVRIGLIEGVGRQIAQLRRAMYPRPEERTIAALSSGTSLAAPTPGSGNGQHADAHRTSAPG